jgi:hypothetical protein
MAGFFDLVSKIACPKKKKIGGMMQDQVIWMPELNDMVLQHGNKEWRAR